MSSLNSVLSTVAVRVAAALASLTVFLSMVLVPAHAYSSPRYAGIVVDGNTGKALYSENADEPRYPASLTKIMTLYILFDYLDKKRITYDTKFYVTPNAASQPPSKLGLKAGQYIRVYDIIGALVTKSANDAAATVAENIAGSVEKFARLMTSRARSLGMQSTVFRNASGLPDRQQVTTARDMARLSMRIMNDFPRYATFFKMRSFGYARRSYRNHNQLLFTYRGMEGIKTGYTRDSGFNLTTSVRRGDKHLIAVVLGGKTAGSRNAQMARLLDTYMPQALAVAKRRPMEQRIAQLDANVRPDSPRYTARPAVEKASRRAANLETASIATTASVEATPAADQYSRRSNVRGFDIQIGAYLSRDEAVANLTSTESAASKVLAGHDAYIMQIDKEGVAYHRARFAGFSSKEVAANACSQLKRKLSINCIIMTP